MSKCIICGSEKVSKLTVKARDTSALEIIKCHHCLHTFQDPSKYKDIYSNGEFTREARAEKKIPTEEKILEFDKRAQKRIDYYGQIVSNFSNTLEIGSAIGSFLNVLKMKGAKITGLEPDIDYSGYSKERYGFNQEAGLLESFIADEKFDSVCSFHVLEHVKDPHSFIDKTADLLEVGGSLLFEFPSMEVHSFGDLQNTYWTPHIHYFTLSSTYHLLAQKFKVKKVGFFGMALYVHAEKTGVSTFDKSHFKWLRLKSKFIRNLMPLIPSVKALGKSKYFWRQMLLAPFLQDNFSKQLRYYWKIFVYHLVLDTIYVKKEKKGSGGEKKGYHVSYHNLWENSGDTILSYCVRHSLNLRFKQKWELDRVTNKVTESTLKNINRCDFLVVGGGGLLLPDSNRNRISGWQWSIDKNQLSQIEVPLIVHSIGYNYFPNQKPDQLFIDNLNALVEKSTFFSLRNHGSIRKVKELIDERLHPKIHWQPCSTTIIRKMFVGLPQKQNDHKSVGLNVAMDRYHRRFGDRLHDVLSGISEAMLDLQNKGYKIHLISHLKGDEIIGHYLTSHGVDFNFVDLQYATNQKVFEFYNSMEIVIGSRGHAQMIAFGLNTKILALGTHNKVKYFLRDFEAENWLINTSLSGPEIREQITEKFHEVVEQKPKEATNILLEAQEKFYQQTQLNLDIIKDLI